MLIGYSNMTKRTFNLSLVILLSEQAWANCLQSKRSIGIVVRKDTAFPVLLSCLHKAAMLAYTENMSTDNVQRDNSSKKYKFDCFSEDLKCQHSSFERYATVNSNYDIGHHAALNIFNSDKNDALEASVLTEVVYQARSFSQTGVWKRTETLLDCYIGGEEYLSLKVYSNTIFENGSPNDYFSDRHNLSQKPDYLSRLFYSESKRKYDAWIMFNDNSPFRRRTFLEIQKRPHSYTYPHEKNEWKETLFAYKAETLRLAFNVSFVLVRLLGSIGIVRLLGPLVIYDTMVSA